MLNNTARGHRKLSPLRLRCLAQGVTQSKNVNANVQPFSWFLFVLTLHMEDELKRTVLPAQRSHNVNTDCSVFRTLSGP